MSYRSILVNIDVDNPVTPVVRLALDLARRFDAHRLIGFCAADAAIPLVITPETGALIADAWQQLRDDLVLRFKQLRSEFEHLVAGSIKAEWLEALDNPTRSLTATAGLADLVVIRAAQGASTGNAYRAADPGSVVLQAGRPVLVAASGADRLPAEKIVIAWKNTREARRAVMDAVPMLHAAAEVTVVAVDDEPDDWLRAGMRNVSSFLATHGIKARTEILEDADETAAVARFLGSVHADLVVSGAYGHSRVREWAFGGMTRSLLDQTGISRLMSG
jgi:nucleotide-binding universal stress UspA family protein